MLSNINENLVETNTKLELNEKLIKIEEMERTIRDLNAEHSDEINSLNSEIEALKDKQKQNDLLNNGLKSDNELLKVFIENNTKTLFKKMDFENQVILQQTKSDILLCMERQKEAQVLHDRLANSSKSIQNKFNDLHSVKIDMMD